MEERYERDFPASWCRTRAAGLVHLFHPIQPNSIRSNVYAIANNHGVICLLEASFSCNSVLEL
jgi:hypothetical protein